MTGNVSSLHWYHRQRVAENDIKPFGKRVGLGTVLCGAATVFYGATQLVYELTSLKVFIWIGTAGTLIGLSVGLFIMLIAIIKYNKRLF